MPGISDAWLEAIDDSTVCLRSAYREDVQAAEDALTYLEELERLSRKKEKHWDRPPKKKPPRIHFSNIMVGEQYTHEETFPAEAAVSYSSNNPFALIQDFDSDDDDDSDDTDSDQEDDDDLDEAGDAPVMFVQGMVMRRLMIRIVTCQSELYAYRSHACRNVRPLPRWQEGSGFCVLALQKIHQALFLADSEISRWMADITSKQLAVSDLMGDADIVAVAIQHLTEESDRFQQEAQHQLNRLRRRLAPQWVSRDQVKNRMGDRWFNNPAPKQDYARRREMDEKQLTEIEVALAELQAIDTEELKISSEELCHRVLTKDGPSSSKNPKEQRYNGLRPADLSRRVSWEDYPDPADFDWFFTGSTTTVEFFERDGVKLDWYFTTGTVKTSLDHPKQGRTQLFGAKVSPEVYRRILTNPREHTNVRYQTRRNRPRRNGKQGRNM